jgi:hypothetical protein
MPLQMQKTRGYQASVAALDHVCRLMPASVAEPNIFVFEISGTQQIESKKRPF